MYWYVSIAAIHKRQTSSFFSSSWLEATGSKNVAPIKTRAFPVIYSGHSHSIYFFFFKTKALKPVSPLCAWHAAARDSWSSCEDERSSENSTAPGPQAKGDLLQTGTETWCPPQNRVQPHWAVQVPARFSSGRHCRTRLLSCCDCHRVAAAAADPPATSSLVSQSSCWEGDVQGQREMELAGRDGGRKERREGAHVLNLP